MRCKYVPSIVAEEISRSSLSSPEQVVHGVLTGRYRQPFHPEQLMSQSLLTKLGLPTTLEVPQLTKGGGDVERHSPFAALVLPHSGWNLALVGCSLARPKGRRRHWTSTLKSGLGIMGILDHLGF